MEVVLVHPEIPQNTGSIARTCAATKTPLQLIEPLGFEITEKAVRRAGLDYWPLVELQQHSSWAAYLEQRRPGRIWLLSKFASRTVYECTFSPGDAFVFGSETKGLGADFLAQFPAECRLRIPMLEPGVRSLNLSNAVSLVLYEALRQVHGWSDLRPDLQSTNATAAAAKITAQPIGSATMK